MSIFSLPAIRKSAVLPLVFLFTPGLAGCAAADKESTSKIIVSASHPLPAELSESSGLHCLGEHALTINDSGNAATVFTIDATARIINAAKLTISNTDWEAITGNEEVIFIGDIGNNRGDRLSLSIEVVNRNTMIPVRSLHIDYDGYSVGQLAPYAHDFDAEAMTWHNDKLLMFSKSWGSRVAHVYEIDTHVKQQTLTAIAHIDGLPGVITGADWDKQRGHYVVVGYASGPFRHFDAFVAEVSPEFDVTNVWPLPDHHQVEGVCVAADGSYWLAQEATKQRQATLSRVISPTPASR